MKRMSDFVSVALPEHFSILNMPYTEKCVNTRNSKKEIIGINGCHPLSEGYLQIADAAYRNMVKSFAYMEV